MAVRDLTARNAIEGRLWVRIHIFIFIYFLFIFFPLNFLRGSVGVVHGPVREVVRGPGPLDRSTDRGSVFSGHPYERPFDLSCQRKPTHSSS